MAFSPDGTRLATSVQEGDAAVAGAANFAVYIWDVATGTQVGNLNVTQNVNFSGMPLAFSPDGALLAVGKPDGTVGLWDVTAGTERYSTPLFNTQAQEVVSAVAYSPDGSVIAAAGGVPFSGGLTGTEVFGIVLLDAATGQLLTRIEAHNSLILDVMFSGDGTLLLSTGDATIRFWGVAQ
jgi:WD40 repeat protein